MIADRAGISVGGLYLHFHGKETLYSTLVETVLEDLSREIEATMKKIPDPVQAMTTLISMRLSYARKNRELIIMSNTECKLALRDEVRKGFFKRQRALIEDIIEKGVRSGDFADCDSQETAKVIVGVLRGFVFSLVVDPDSLFSPEACTRLVLRGLLSERSGKNGSEGIGKP